MADHGLRPDELDRERRPQVFRRLHILAALLSLTWDEAWQLRRVPLPSRSWRTVVPQSWSPPEPWHEEPRDRRDISVEEHLPQQTQNRWALADTDGSTRQALLAWHQAILVTDAPPLTRTHSLHGRRRSRRFSACPRHEGPGKKIRSRARQGGQCSGREPAQPGLPTEQHRARGRLRASRGCSASTPGVAENGAGWMTDPGVPEFRFVLRTLPLLTDVARRVCHGRAGEQLSGGGSAPDVLCRHG